uniref:RRM domain-containing protein n=1 Tax=Strigamia maritima TaxID=126957 RepID=T1IXF0_STRMM
MADQDYSHYSEYAQDDGDQGYDYAEEDNGEYCVDQCESSEGQIGSTDFLGDRRRNRDADDDKKLFIGGLGWGTTQDDLQSHFSKYGGVVQVTIKTNPTTGRSRGFAFIQFLSKDAVDRVLITGPHLINGTQVDPKRVKARRSGYNKVFVGGLDPDLPESEIRAYFERYGKIEGIELPYDKIRNQRKQFCFVAFESEDVVDQICKQAKQRIGGKECDVKKATRRQGPRVGGTEASWGRQNYSYDYGVGGRRRGRGKGRSVGGYGQTRDFAASYGSYGSGYDEYAAAYGGQSYGNQSYGNNVGYGNYGGYGK